MKDEQIITNTDLEGCNDDLSQNTIFGGLLSSG